MNPLEFLRDLVAQVPEFIQPLIVAAAGAVPFIEGEGAAALGIVFGGVAPVVAGISAAVGNFVCVAILVLATSRARGAIVTSHRRRVAARVAGADADSTASAPVAAAPIVENERKAARRAKFQRAFERFGVPGVSLLGPLVLPTHFTATMLAATGIGKGRILAWQALAIALWTTAFTLLAAGIVSVAR